MKFALLMKLSPPLLTALLGLIILVSTLTFIEIDAVAVDNYVQAPDPEPCSESSSAASSSTYQLMHPRNGWVPIDVCANLKRVPFYALISAFIDEGDGLVEAASGYGENTLHFGPLIGDEGFIASFSNWDHKSMMADTTVKSKANGLTDVDIKRFKKYPGAHMMDLIPLNTSVYDVCVNPIKAATPKSNTFAFLCETPTITTYGYDVFDRQCPSVLLFNVSQGVHDSEVSLYLDALIGGGQRMINDCHPTIYVEDVTPTSAHALFDILELFGYTDIFWQVTVETTVRPTEALNAGKGKNKNKKATAGVNADGTTTSSSAVESHNRLVASVVAIQPQRKARLTEALLKTAKLVRYQKGNHYLSQYDMSSVLPADTQNDALTVAWQRNCPDGTVSPCHVYTKTAFNVEMSRLAFSNSVKVVKPVFNVSALAGPLNTFNISLSLVDIAHPIAHGVSYPGSKRLAKFYQALQDEIMSSSISPKHPLASFQMSYQFTTPSSAAPLLAKVHCTAWIQSVYQETTKNAISEYTRLPAKEASDRLTAETKELASLVSSCVDLVTKQYIIRRDSIASAATIEPTTNTNASSKKKSKSSSVADQEDDESSAASDASASTDLEPYRSGKVFDPSAVVPFKRRYKKKGCYDPIWCAQTEEFQRRIKSWQFPDDPRSFLGTSAVVANRTCANSKFMLYEPLTDRHGIGAMIEQIATAFRLALCLDRILVVLPVNQPPTWLKWRHPGCRGNAFECYFEDMHGCTLSEQDIKSAPVATQSHDQYAKYPLNQARIIRAQGVMTSGPCKFCGSSWTGSRNFFQGLVTEQFDMTIDPNGQLGESGQPTAAWTARYDERTTPLDFNAFLTEVKLPWIAQFVRYIIRPRKWFAAYLQDLVKSSLRGPNNTVVDTIPHPYASLHVRYGFKFAEAQLEPLSRYRQALNSKAAGIKTVFVSTETEKVIAKMQLKYSDLRVYYLKYPRVEYLQLQQDTSGGQDYIQEFVYSMANLYVSSEADAFVGTLSSNWCRMIQDMERTRGDGGAEYISVDSGSQFTVCL